MECMGLETMLDQIDSTTDSTVCGGAAKPKSAPEPPSALDGLSVGICTGSQRILVRRLTPLFLNPPSWFLPFFKSSICGTR